MKNRIKALLAVLCAVMLVAASVVGTLAYLTDTEEAVNTFTVGNVAIKLDETDVDIYGVKDGDARVNRNEYKLIPGHSYIKDPTIHVDANSENCWLFVKIVDEIADIQDTETVAEQMKKNGWTKIPDTGIYAYANISKAGDDVVIFDNFKIKGDVSNDKLATYAGETITVTAYAIQADGFESAAAAWEAACTAFPNP